MGLAKQTAGRKGFLGGGSSMCKGPAWRQETVWCALATSGPLVIMGIHLGTQTQKSCFILHSSLRAPFLHASENITPPFLVFLRFVRCSEILYWAKSGVSYQSPWFNTEVLWSHLPLPPSCARICQDQEPSSEALWEPLLPGVLLPPQTLSRSRSGPRCGGPPHLLPEESFSGLRARDAGEPAFSTASSPLGLLSISVNLHLSSLRTL